MWVQKWDKDEQNVFVEKDFYSWQKLGRVEVDMWSYGE